MAFPQPPAPPELLQMLGQGGGAPLGPGGPPGSHPGNPIEARKADILGQQGGGQPGGDPQDLVQKAAMLIKQAIDGEPDHEDKLLLEKITTECQQYLATQQKLGDTAMGAGPGAKMVRKATARTQGGGGGGGY